MVRACVVSTTCSVVHFKAGEVLDMCWRWLSLEREERTARERLKEARGYGESLVFSPVLWTDDEGVVEAGRSVGASEKDYGTGFVDPRCGMM